MKRPRPVSIGFVISVLFFVSVVVVTLLVVWPDTRTIDAEKTISQVTDAGILQALGDEEVSLSDRTQVEGAVVEEVTISAANTAEESDAPAVVEDDLAEVATQTATEAVIDIFAGAKVGVKEAIEDLPRTAQPENIEQAAAAIAEAALRDVDLGPGDLAEEEKVSAAIAGTLTEGQGQQVIEELDLTPDQATQLQTAAESALTSSILQSSEAAATATVDELPNSSKKQFEMRRTKFLESTTQYVMGGIGSVIVTGLMIPALATMTRAMLLSGPLELQRMSGGSLRYATARHCTISGIRLEKPNFFFRNEVRSQTMVQGRTLPFVLTPGDGELDISFEGRSCVTWSWNIRLLWWQLIEGRSDRSFCAFQVNGRWYLYRIAV